MKPHIIDFLKYLESKGEKRVPIKVRLLYSDKFSPFTEKDLNIEGNLNLSFTDIKSLPDNLKIGGNLSFTQSSIRTLPDNLTVEGSLDLTEEVINNSLPNNLKVEGRLYIRRWGTPLFKTKTIEEIKQEIEERGGYVRGGIYLMKMTRTVEEIKGSIKIF